MRGMPDARDYAYLWAWEPIHPEAIAEPLSGFARPWWICGGWALDLFLDRETRRHDDLDVALLRHDQLALYRHFRDWDLHYATPTHALEPWDGRKLDPPIHGIWARRSENIGDERNGVPFLRPEIVLLYKSSVRSPKNDTDFAAVLPRLSREARLWLRAALERHDRRHPWLEALGAGSYDSREPLR